MPKKTKEVKTDSQLEKEKKNNEHKRSERFKNVISNTVISVIIFAVVIILFVLCYMIWHWIDVSDYTSMYEALKISIGAAVGYFISYIKKNY